MSDFGKMISDVWLKINEGVGSAAGSLAESAQHKVSELNMESRRNELSRTLIQEILALHAQNVKLPDTLQPLVDELARLQEEIQQLRGKKEEKKAPEATSDEKEVPVLDPTKFVSFRREDATDPSVEEVKTPAAEKAEEAEEDDKVLYMNPEAEKAAEACGQTQEDQTSEPEPESEHETESESESADSHSEKMQSILDELDHATEEFVDRVQNSQEMEKVRNRMEAAGQSFGDLLDKAAGGMDHVMEKTGQAISSLLDSLARRVDRNPGDSDVGSQPVTPESGKDSGKDDGAVDPKQ